MKEVSQDRQFYKDAFNNKLYDEYKHIVYLGDFIVALNNELNTSGYLHNNNLRTREYMKSRITTNELGNVWREKMKRPRTSPFRINKLIIAPVQGLTSFLYHRTL